MDFIQKIFNIKIRYTNDENNYQLPNYMISRYSIKSVFMVNQKVFLMYPKTELESISTLKKRINKMKSYENIPVILVLEKITARQRQAMIDNNIPFIVSSKQCYLPFLGMLLTEKCDSEVETLNKLTPSAQMLLFYYIYSHQKEIYTSSAVEDLGVSAMTITRAVRQLEQAELVHVYKSGVQKIMTTEYTQKELFEKASPYLSNPVKKTCYISKDTLDDSLIYAGDSALSIVSMLNPPLIACYATDNYEKWKDDKTDDLMNDEEQVELQAWRYNPKVLTRNNHVDVLSLATYYFDDEDERIEECVEEMLKDYWRE